MYVYVCVCVFNVKIQMALIPIVGFATYGAVLWIYKRWTYKQRRIRIICSAKDSKPKMSIEQMALLIADTNKTTVSCYIPSKEAYDTFLLSMRLIHLVGVRIEMVWKDESGICSDCFDLIATG